MTPGAVRQRRYRLTYAGVRCSRCLRRGVVPGLCRCAVCVALDAERKPWLLEMRHHTKAHAAMLVEARLPWSRCAVLGLTLGALEMIGEVLQVDRIDEGDGYRVGNMQLLCATLNRAKQQGEGWMRYKAEQLRMKYEIARERDERWARQRAARGAGLAARARGSAAAG